MRIILGVALLALCALGKEEDKIKDEKSDVTKRAFAHSLGHTTGHDLSHTLTHGLYGVASHPKAVIGSGIHHSNLYVGELDYGKDYSYALGNSYIGDGIHNHHVISSPPATVPEVITRTVTVDKPYPLPQPVPVKVDRPVSVPVAVPQPYPVPVKKPYPVEFVKPVAVPVEKEVPYEVVKPVPYPVEEIVHYPVEKRVYYPVHIPVERRYTVHIPKPYPVYEEKTERYPVERLVHVPVHVKVDVPVPQPVPVPVDKPYPVKVSHPVPVPVERPVPVTVHNPVPVPVVKKVAVPVPHPVPFHVEKHVPVPVTYKTHIPTHFGDDGGVGIDVRHGLEGFDHSFDLGSHVKSDLHGTVLGGKLGEKYLLGDHSTGSFTTGGHLPTSTYLPTTNDFSHLFSSHSFGRDSLDTFGGSTLVDIDKSVEIPLKTYRSTTDKFETEAKASEPVPVKVKKEDKVKSE